MATKRIDRKIADRVVCRDQRHGIGLRCRRSSRRAVVVGLLFGSDLPVRRRIHQNLRRDTRSQTGRISGCGSAGNGVGTARTIQSWANSPQSTTVSIRRRPPHNGNCGSHRSVSACAANGGRMSGPQNALARANLSQLWLAPISLIWCSFLFRVYRIAATRSTGRGNPGRPTSTKRAQRFRAGSARSTPGSETRPVQAPREIRTGCAGGSAA